MPTARPDPAAVRRLLKLAGAHPGGEATDRELIERFVNDRSEAAFADLMARHGPMVRAVCRRALRDPADADDAFQATFLVLARRAASVRWREGVGGWLFAVAARVARKAAAQAARRSAREGTPADAAPEPAAPAPPADLTALQAALDDELRMLPEKLRTPVVLCHLEGLSQEQVARHLGVTDGQLRGRLYRAKERLRENLLRRGFTLSAVLLALAVAPAAQAVPAVLATATLRLAASPAAAPPAVLELVQGVIRDMSYALKSVAVAAVLGLAVAAGGFAAALAEPAESAPIARAARPQLPPIPLPQPVAAPDDEKKADPKQKVEKVRGTIKGVTPDKNVIRVRVEEGESDADVALAAGTKVRFGKSAIGLADLKPGMRVELVYVGETNSPAEVVASWRRTTSKVKAVDPAKNTLAVAVENDDVEFDVTLPVAPDAAVTVDHLPAGVADVRAGQKVSLDLGIDKKTIVGIDAEGDPGDLPAVVKKYDAVAGTLLVEFEAEANDFSRRVTLALPVNADAPVRLAGKDVKLADLKERMPVRLRMTPDRKAVAGVLAGEPLPVEKDDD